MPTLAQIKNELTTDPNGYGYAQFMPSADFNPPALAELLNRVRANISIVRTDVTPGEIRRCILVEEFITGQTILMGSWFESLMQSTSNDIVLKNPDGTNANDLKNLKRMLVNNSASENAVVAIATRSGSRSEQLWGEKTSISVQEVIDAVRS